MASFPSTKQLTTYKVIPYYWMGNINPSLEDEELELCDYAMHMMREECKGDRLEKNYTKEHMHLDKMIMYNIVFDDYKPVIGTGTQKINDNVVRVFSRYWHFKSYRTDGKYMFDKVDDFEELKYTIDNVNAKCYIWSRDKSKGFFTKLKKHRPDVFQDWIVHPEKVNLLYPNNYQYVFYKGDISLL